MAVQYDSTRFSAQSKLCGGPYTFAVSLGAPQAGPGLTFLGMAAIYGSHMGELMKTTVYLEAADYRRLKVLAQAEGRKAADLIREAVAEYAQRRVTSRRPRTIGMAASGLADLAQRDEEYLDGFGQES